MRSRSDCSDGTQSDESWVVRMIGVLFATEKEAAPLKASGVPSGVTIKVAEEMGLEAARIAAEELVAEGATAIINAGVCGGLHNRVERGAVLSHFNGHYRRA